MSETPETSLSSDTSIHRGGVLPDMERLQPVFEKLVLVIAQLRGPDGCPWDRAQTLESIKPHTLEETYELLDAIDSGEDAAIVEELGDLLLQILLDSQIGADEGRFTLVDIIEILTEKLIRRHPHVFGDAHAETPDQVLQRWERIKHKEKERASILDGLPVVMPALARAARMTAKAARVGFDFPHRAMLFDKLREEIEELAVELFANGKIPDMAATVDEEPTPDEPIEDPDRRQRVESEIGDILFVIANIARRWKINPEEALRHSNRKFERRFRYIEDKLTASGRNIRDVTLHEMEDLYQEGKQQGIGER